MLKETKTEETIVFFVTFLSLVAFNWGGPGPLPWLRLWLIYCQHPREVVTINKHHFYDPPYEWGDSSISSHCTISKANEASRTGVIPSLHTFNLEKPTWIRLKAIHGIW